MKFEFLDHTADLKIKVYGENIENLFENSILAITSFISNGEGIDSNSIREFNITGKDNNEILYKFLDEIIYLMDVENFIPSKGKVKYKENEIEVSLFGNENSKIKLNQIKSATYHDMKINLDNKNNLFIEFVLDI